MLTHFCLGILLYALASGSTVVPLDSPAGPGSGEPHLVASEGQLYLSWLEPFTGGHALKFSRWNGERWTPPRAIVTSGSMFVNWADFPSLLALSDGSLVAHWPEKGGKGVYEYNVMISSSTDGGQSWTEPVSPHRDGTLSEHGFVSLIDLGEGRFGAVWLDGRQFKAGAKDLENEMSLRFARYEKGGFQTEVLLDKRVCDCCQTAAAVTRDGTFVAYRDRGADEIRDISCVTYTGGTWSEPRTLFPDRWEIPACPVNGPSVAANGSSVAVAWFTFAAQKGRVQLVFSEDGGKSFGAPVRIDAGSPAGRVDVEWLSESAVLVSWLEQTEGTSGEIRARSVRVDGTAEPAFLVARTTSGRLSGFPRMARRGDEVFFAWTDASLSRTQVRVAKMQLEQRSTSR